LTDPQTLLPTPEKKMLKKDEQNGENQEGVLVGDYERGELHKNVTELIMFPLLRLELQGFPYLSTHIARLFLSVAKEETEGLKQIMNNITRDRTFDLTDAQKKLNDGYSQFVVKVYCRFLLHFPFTWRMVGYILKNTMEVMPIEILHNLPELRSLHDNEDIVNFVLNKYHTLTQHLFEFLRGHSSMEDNDGPINSEHDIRLCYNKISELHRVVEEILFFNKIKKTDKTKKSPKDNTLSVGQKFDRKIDEIIDQHSGWIQQDLAVAHVLEKGGDLAISKFFASIRDNQDKSVAEKEKMQAFNLQEAYLDSMLLHREDARKSYEEENSIFHSLNGHDALMLTQQLDELETLGKINLDDLEANPLDAKDHDKYLRSILSRNLYETIRSGKNKNDSKTNSQSLERKVSNEETDDPSDNIDDLDTFKTKV